MGLEHGCAGWPRRASRKDAFVLEAELRSLRTPPPDPQERCLRIFSGGPLASDELLATSLGATALERPKLACAGRARLLTADAEAAPGMPLERTCSGGRGTTGTARADEATSTDE
eukprot:12702261-Alexandrium_andersonii.AAC.1